MMTVMSPLPLPALQLQESDPSKAAYSNVLQAEARALQDGANENVVFARVVGRLLLELYARRDILGSGPYARVIDDVIRSSQDRDSDLQIFELGKRYRDHLICAFWMPPVDQGVELGSKHPDVDMPGTCDVVVTHILSDGFIGAIAIMELGLEGLSRNLEAGDGVNEAWNLLSLGSGLSQIFGVFGLWFEGTDEDNKYKICCFHPEIERYIRAVSIRPGTSGPDAPLTVKFRSDHPYLLPPDRQLLALHATCARVARLSGAAKFFDEFVCGPNDNEESETLLPMVRRLIIPTI